MKRPMVRVAKFQEGSGDTFWLVQKKNRFLFWSWWTSVSDRYLSEERAISGGQAYLRRYFSSETRLVSFVLVDHPFLKEDKGAQDEHCCNG